MDELRSTIYHGLRRGEFTDDTAARLLREIGMKRLEVGGLEAAYVELRRQQLAEEIRQHLGLHGFYGDVPIVMHWGDGPGEAVLVRIGDCEWGSLEPTLVVKNKLKSGKLSKCEQTLSSNQLRFMKRIKTDGKP